jgi:hypothetical protein
MTLGVTQYYLCNEVGNILLYSLTLSDLDKIHNKNELKVYYRKMIKCKIFIINYVLEDAA